MSTKPTNDDNHDRYIVPGLKRGIDILGLFSQDCPTLRLTEIASRLGISRSSAFRLTYTLENIGLLERDEEGRFFHLANGILRLGFEYLSSLEIVEIARTPLEALRDKTGLSSHLAVLDRQDIAHLLRFNSLQGFTSNVAVGSRRPAHATPMGRMLLCEKPSSDLSKLYEDYAFERKTDQNPGSLEELESLLAADRERGFVVSWGFYLPSGGSAAGPIRDTSGEIVAAINVSGPTDVLTLDEIEGRIKDSVCKTAAEISKRLGFVSAKHKIHQQRA